MFIIIYRLLAVHLKLQSVTCLVKMIQNLFLSKYISSNVTKALNAKFIL